MRTIVIVAILLLGISSVAPEPDLVEPSPVTATEARSGTPAPSVQIAPATAPNSGYAPSPNPAQAESTPSRSVDDVCNMLFTSAQDNGLPVAFFANLIWQESRLRGNALSPKGAMGIAQFMPKVATKSGVENPFDPLQALPASAKLLRELFDRFGNLGYVAAAYNAGAQRVTDWLEHRRPLPRETRDYVMHITGRSVEAWRKIPQGDADLRFAPRLPCRGLPAFAALVQAQAQQAELERKQTEQARAQAIPSQQPTPSPQKTASQQTRATREKAAAAERAHLAKDNHSRKPIRREEVRTAERERPRIKHEARGRIHYVRGEGYRRA